MLEDTSWCFHNNVLCRRLWKPKCFQNKAGLIAACWVWPWQNTILNWTGFWCWFEVGMKYSGNFVCMGQLWSLFFFELCGVSCLENIQDYNNVFCLIPIIIILIILIMWVVYWWKVGRTLTRYTLDYLHQQWFKVYMAIQAAFKKVNPFLEYALVIFVEMSFNISLMFYLCSICHRL